MVNCAPLTTAGNADAQSQGNFILLDAIEHSPGDIEITVMILNVVLPFFFNSHDVNLYLS